MFISTFLNLVALVLLVISFIACFGPVTRTVDAVFTVSYLVGTVYAALGAVTAEPFASITMVLVMVEYAFVAWYTMVIVIKSGEN